jgi:hypothetical protein
MPPYINVIHDTILNVTKLFCEFSELKPYSPLPDFLKEIYVR